MGEAQGVNTVALDALVKQLVGLKQYSSHRILIVTGTGVTAAATADAAGNPHPAASWPGLIRLAVGYLESTYRTELAAPENFRARRALLSVQRELDDPAVDENHDMLVAQAQDVFEAYTAVGNEDSFSTWLHGVVGTMKQKDDRLLAAIRSVADLFPTALYATTNYDDLLSEYLGREAVSLHDDSAPPLNQLLDRTPVPVLHLHGRYNIRNESIFSRDQYDEICRINAAEGSAVSQLFDQTVPIFIGCGSGLNDLDISTLLRRRATKHHDLDAIAIVDSHVTIKQSGCTEYRFENNDGTLPVKFGDLPVFLEQLALAVRGRLSGRSTRPYAKAVASDQSSVRVFPVVIEGQRIDNVPLTGFFGTLYVENIRKVEILAGRGRVQSESYHVRGGTASALESRPSGPPIEIEALLEWPFSVVLGDPGTGKTSLVRVLAKREAARFAADPDDRSTIFPIFVDLSVYHGAMQGDDGASLALDAWIVSQVREIGGFASDPETRALIESFAQAGRLLLIFDGLDEVANSEDRQRVVEDIERCERWVQGALGSDRSNRIVVTSRVSGYLNAPVTVKNARFFSVGPIAVEQIGAFLDVFFDGLVAERPNIEREIRALRESLRSALEASGAVADEFMQTPLLAAMLVAVYCADRALPPDLVSLFERVTEISCDHTLELLVQAGQVAELPTRDDLIAVLARAAHQMFERHWAGDLIARDTLELAIHEQFSRVSDGGVRAIAGALTGDSGFLREKASTLFGFVHRILQEYLCGRYLASLSQEAVAAAAERPGSTQPVIFAAMRFAAIGGSATGELALKMRNASNLANGGRPWLLFLAALGGGPLLPFETAVEISTLHLGLTESFGPMIRRTAAERPFTQRMKRLIEKPVFGSALQKTVLIALEQGAERPTKAIAAAHLIESLELENDESIAAMRRCIGDVDVSSGRLVAEPLRRCVTRLVDGAGSEEQGDAALPAGSAAFLDPDGAREVLVNPRWMRVVSALAGGFADYDMAFEHWRYWTIARYVSTAGYARDELVGTMPRPLRDVMRDREPVVTPKDESGKIPEDEPEFDPIMSLAASLDIDLVPALKRKMGTPWFDTRFLWRQPALAQEILAAVRRKRDPGSLLDTRVSGVKSVEQSIAALMLGRGAKAGYDYAVLERLAATADDLRDVAMRSAATITNLMAENAVPGDDVEASVLIDALSSLDAELSLPFGRKAIADYAKTPSARYSALREIVGRGIAGSVSEDVGEAGQVLESLFAQDLLDGLARAGDSRVLREAVAAFDVPAFPPSYAIGQDDRALADLLDVVEACPPQIALTRWGVLEYLAEGLTSWSASGNLEVETLLALSRGDFALAHEKARSQVDPGSRARSLMRLAARSSPSLETDLESSIIQALAEIRDPFARARALEMRAVRCRNGASARNAAAEACAVRNLEPCIRARLLIRVAVFLPARERAVALLDAVKEARRIKEAWPRAETLRAIRPFVRRNAKAWERFRRAMDSLPALLRAYALGQRGEVLRLLFDGPLKDGQDIREYMAPLATYALAVDTRQNAGLDIDESVLLEQVDARDTRSVDRVRNAFDGARLPRMSAAGLVAVRDLIDGGHRAAARDIVARTGAFPPGARFVAELVCDSGDPLPELIDAATRGITPHSAGAVIDTLSDEDDLVRARAAVMLHLPSEEFRGTDDPAEYRRASILGFETLLAIAAHAAKAPVYASQRASRFMEYTLFDSAAMARKLVERSRASSRNTDALWLLGSIASCTPEFLHAAFETADLDREVDVVPLLRLAACAAYRVPWVKDALPAATVELIREAAKRARRTIFTIDARKLAELFAKAPKPGTTVRDLDEAAQAADLTTSWYELVSGDNWWEALGSAAENQFFRYFNQEERADSGIAAEIMLKKEGGLRKLISATAETVRQRISGDVPYAETHRVSVGVDLLSPAMTIAAAAAERSPNTVADLLSHSGLFDVLHLVASEQPDFNVRREAFIVMPLRWSWGKSPAAPREDVRAALLAGRDKLAVRSAAERMMSMIRDISYDTLSLLVNESATSTQQTYMLAQALIRIVANGRANRKVQQLCGATLDAILTGPNAGKYLVHTLLTASAPPRSQLKDLVFHEIMLNAV